jgi:hypothetical protein
MELPVTKARKFGFKVTTQTDVPFTLVPLANNLKTSTCKIWRLHNFCLDHSHLAVLSVMYPQVHSCTNIDGLGGY